MSKSCDCIEKIDADLKPRGYTLDASFSFSGQPSMPRVPLLRLDGYKPETRRGKPSFMAVQFCPWCGTKYPVAQDATP